MNTETLLIALTVRDAAIRAYLANPTEETKAAAVSANIQFMYLAAKAVA